LIEAIARLAESPAERAALAARGRRRIVEHFDQGEMLRRFSALVRDKTLSS
jgi:glycosyltransferase involved in cell wall biosynthesis